VKQKRPTAAQSGVSVVRLLAVAAVLGLVAGVVLAKTRHPEDEMMEASPSVIDEALPGVAAARAPRRSDMMAPDPVSLRGIPAYPGARPRKIVGSSGPIVNAISWFATEDGVDRVLSYYEDAYTAHNVLYVAHRWGQKSGYVSWFEHSRNADGGLPEYGAGVLHMVSAFRDGETTTVLVSATDPEAILHQLSPLPAGVSLPPGARPQIINTGEAGQERAAIFASFPALSPPELASDLELRMQRAGWTVTDHLTAPDGRVTLVGKQGPRVQLAVIDAVSEGSQVLMTLEEK
jgi:hypothetical protein